MSDQISDNSTIFHYLECRQLADSVNSRFPNLRLLTALRHKADGHPAVSRIGTFGQQETTLKIKEDPIREAVM
jgi:hypothetical protein